MKELASGSFAGNWFFLFFLGNDVTGSLKKRGEAEDFSCVLVVRALLSQDYYLFVYVLFTCFVSRGLLTVYLLFLMPLMIVSWFLDVWVWVKYREFKEMVTEKIFNVDKGVWITEESNNIQLYIILSYYII